MDESNGYNRLLMSVFRLLDGPVTYFREKIVEPNQQKYPWYHQQFRRVPTIDECHELDLPCVEEANYQFLRDKEVEATILEILRQRYEDCRTVNHVEASTFCDDIYNTYVEASGAWFTKYGDLGIRCHTIAAFMKQKHRMIWERRHGPVGSGMNPKYYRVYNKEEQ